MNTIFSRALLGSVALIALVSPSAFAKEADPVQPVPVEPGADYDRFTLRAGAFLLSSIKTTLSLDAEGEQVGEEVDFSKDLGGDKSLNVFRLDAEWRFARNHRIELSYFDIDLTTRYTLERDIEWGDEIYPVNAVVDSQFRTAVSKLTYGYAFYHYKDHEFIALIGTHITRLEAGISAPNLGSEGIGVTAPLPVFGVEWRGRLSERLTAQVSYEYFGISLEDKYSGNLSDFEAFVDYSLSDHWSLGGGYNRYVLRASVESERLKLTMNHSYNGLIAYLSARF